MILENSMTYLRSIRRSRLGITLNTQWNNQPIPVYHCKERGALHFKDMVLLLDSCKDNKSLSRLKQVHAQFTVRGYIDTAKISCKMLENYVTCNSIHDARHVFDRMPIRTCYTYSQLIKGYLDAGVYQESLRLFYEMAEHLGIPPDKFTFAFVAKACAGLQSQDDANRIYNDFRKRKIDMSSYLGNLFIEMFGKCKKVGDARQVFDKMPDKNLFTWGAMISTYVLNGFLEQALDLLHLMRGKGILPDANIVLKVLLACGELGLLHEGREIHRLALDCGIESNLEIKNALVVMYCKCGSLREARGVFDVMPVRDAMAWEGLISGYCQNGMDDDALDMYKWMVESHIRPNWIITVGLLGVCGRLRDGKKGRSIHCWVLKGIEFGGVVNSCLIDMYSSSCFIDMYSKCADMGSARNLFVRMPYKNVVTWTSMISGCTQNCLGTEALVIYCKMQDAGIMPNLLTLTSLLGACGQLKDARKGKSIHSCVLKGFQWDAVIGSALVAMYCDCGETDIARDLFERLACKNVVTWNTMICGLYNNGLFIEALEMFREMQGLGPEVKMDGNYLITVGSALRACGNASALRHGASIHGNAFRLGIVSHVHVGKALIHMYFKLSQLQTARIVFNRMCSNEMMSWSSAISDHGISSCSKEALGL